jgi:hypothetical protein
LGQSTYSDLVLNKWRNKYKMSRSWPDWSGINAHK